MRELKTSPFSWACFIPSFEKQKTAHGVRRARFFVILIKNSAPEVERVVTISEQTATDPECNRGLMDSAVAFAKKPAIRTERTSTCTASRGTFWHPCGVLSIAVVGQPVSFIERVGLAKNNGKYVFLLATLGHGRSRECVLRCAVAQLFGRSCASDQAIR